MDFLWGLALFLFGSLTPGIAVASLVVDRRDTLALLTLGTVLGVFVVPFLSFSLALLLGTRISPALILCVGLGVTFPAVLYSVLSRRGTRASDPVHPSEVEPPCS
jgi:Kef-type K+ transport system membrane component KefB